MVIAGWLPQHLNALSISNESKERRLAPPPATSCSGRVRPVSMSWIFEGTTSAQDGRTIVLI
jgi:hypothetical protein